jgi:anti-anti-sigma factor
MAAFQVHSNGPSTFFLDGELDAATVPKLELALADAVAEGGPITLDASRMRFVDSTGVGAILRSAKSLRLGCIILHGVRGEVRRVTDVMGVENAPNMHVIPCDVLT